MTSLKKSLLITFIITISIYLVVSIALFGLSLRKAFMAKKQADQISVDFQQGNLTGVLRDLSSLNDSLQAADRLRKPSFWMAGIPIIRSDYVVYRESLKAGTTITTSLNQAVDTLASQNLSRTLSFDTIDIKSAPTLLLDIYDDLLMAGDHLLAAADASAHLHLQALPEPFKSQAMEVQKQLSAAATEFTSVKPYLEQVPFLLGAEKPHEVLLLLENPHELRPTGGFIGTVGRITFDKGQITQFGTDDVYNLDVHLLGKESIPAPLPLQKFANVQWLYLRDANWSPDFQVSAEQILRIYQQETDIDSIDTVVAITPYLIERLIDITGPLEAGGIVFTSQNLIDALQFRVEQEFWRLGLSDEERKTIINDLSLVLKDHLFALDQQQSKQVVNEFLDAAAKGELLFYTKNRSFHDFLSERGWTGNVDQTEDDYLYVVDANIGALKTDRLVERTRDYSVAKQDDGSYLATLRLTYKNNGFFDYRTTRYRTYTRVYVPIGSELVTSTGFVTGDKSYAYVAPESYAEFDKTVFAGFISVEPGAQRYAELTYRLPEWLADRIASEQRYKLHIQKQPGVAPYQVHFTLNQDKRLISLAPSALDYRLKNETSIQFNDTIERDKDYVLRFAD